MAKHRLLKKSLSSLVKRIGENSMNKEMRITITLPHDGMNDAAFAGIAKQARELTNSSPYGGASIEIVEDDVTENSRLIMVCPLCDGIVHQGLIYKHV
jgi:hypothetical protein